MNDVKKIDGTPRFVCLKVSDKMPARSLAADFGDLFLRFLDAILTQILSPELDQCLYNRRRMSLADRNQFDLFGLAARGARGRGNALAYSRKSCCQLFLRRRDVSHMRDSIDNHNNPVTKNAVEAALKLMPMVAQRDEHGLAVPGCSAAPFPHWPNFKEEFMKLSATKKLFGILVLGLLLSAGMSSDAMAQGRGRRGSGWDRKCEKFVNCHDAP